MVEKEGVCVWVGSLSSRVLLLTGEEGKAEVEHHRFTVRR